MDMIQHGTLAPVVDEVLPLERAVEGLRLIERREVFGKVIVTP
jgi:NADPH:quinone reductase-like Zn-dependent oxidoreductase